MIREIRIVDAPINDAFDEHDLRRLIELRGNAEGLRALLRLSASLDAKKAISFAYLALLGREADQDGLDIHCLLLRSGTPLLDVLLLLTSSAEFTGDIKEHETASLSDEEYIHFIYRRVLHRIADLSGHAHHLANLQGGMLRKKIENVIRQSLEAKHIAKQRQKMIKILRRESFRRNFHKFTGHRKIITIDNNAFKQTTPDTPNKEIENNLLTALMDSEWIKSLPQSRQIAIRSILNHDQS